MAVAHQTAGGTVTESPLVLTEVVTDQGVTGYSIVFTYSAIALEPTAQLVKNLEPLVAGQALAPREIHDKLAARFRLLGAQGLVGMAIAAIDMALWDALARVHEVSLARLLGGVEKPIPAYGGIGYDGASASAAVAEDWARRGFRGVKAKIGYPTLAEDVEVIRAIRSAAGPGVAIMVDYNQSLTPREAVERMRELDEEGLAWVEEPTLAHDYAGHAEIAREARTPIQCGENWWGPLNVRHAIDAKASDYIMLDAMKVGGVTGWTNAAAMAGAHGIRISSHLWPELSAQLLSVTPNAHWLEYIDWWNPVMVEPLCVQDGMAIPCDVSGSGVRWNSDAVDRFAV